MKPLSVLIDTSCWPPDAPGRTGTLIAQHEPELLPDGWLRFKSDGNWYRLPPHAVKCVAEYRDSDKNIEKSIPETKPTQKITEVPYLVSKRGRPPKQ